MWQREAAKLFLVRPPDLLAGACETPTLDGVSFLPTFLVHPSPSVPLQQLDEHVSTMLPFYLVGVTKYSSTVEHEEATGGSTRTSAVLRGIGMERSQPSNSGRVREALSKRSVEGWDCFSFFLIVSLGHEQRWDLVGCCWGSELRERGKEKKGGDEGDGRLALLPLLPPRTG